MVSSPGGGDTKGPVCPCLAHALHSHTLSSPGEEGAWKERGLPLGPEPGLPFSAPLPASAGSCSVLSLRSISAQLQGPGVSWTGRGLAQVGRGSGGPAFRGQGPLQTL